MATEIIYQGGMKFLGKSQTGHELVMDSAPEVGGENLGFRPMELTLIALGGCTGIDVVSILKKMRVDIERFSMDMENERKDEHPKTFRGIVVNYRFTAQEEHRDKISRAVHLSQEKYCSVSAMLAASSEITARIYINGILFETLEHGT